ncbi:hypothetical protein H8B09_19140 [Paenibacillus sp. PR3]|uniref:Condensation domain-containing protein n=1 Tax=Paenibacillus terricola TaxID=2763503 RepID=A0ABR8MZ82_9BACL|nr:condensation domain-containing protein [Paenibacillus terricola]MBD3920890.1 hypothetical protein [Paenibacillus terricola]
MIRSELTAIQRNMYICNRLPVYRLPLLYAMETVHTYDVVEEALYTTIRECEALQVHYEYEPEGRVFYQRHEPLRCEQFLVPTRHVSMDLEVYIADELKPIDLTAGYPWRFLFLEHQGQRYLYAEFHHICIDGLGIRSFENALFNRLMGQELVPSIENPSVNVTAELGSLSIYDQIHALQRAGDQEREAVSSVDIPLQLPIQKRDGHSGVGRLRRQLTAEQLERIGRLATEYKVTKNAVYQAAVEQALSAVCEGQAYGTIGNWRIRLRNLGSIGCFVRMKPALIATEETLEQKARRVFQDNLLDWSGKGVIAPAGTPFSIVYSYEEDMFARFRYLPVDRLSKFDLYIRVFTYGTEANIEVEYNRSKHTEEQAAIIYERLEDILGSFAKEESISGLIG